MATRVMLLLIGLVVLVPGEAAGTSAEILQAYCSGLGVGTPEGTAGGMFCVGYLAGVSDASRLIAEAAPQLRSSCLPSEGISNEDAVRVFGEWLMKNQDKVGSGLGGAPAVMASLKDAYPCSAEGR